MIASPRAPRSRAQKLKACGVEVIRGKLEGPTKHQGPAKLQLLPVLKLLASRGIMSVLIEGGGGLNASALHQRVVDKVAFFIAPKIIGGVNAKTPVEGEGVGKLSRSLTLYDMRSEILGEDLLVEGYLIARKIPVR